MLWRLDMLSLLLGIGLGLLLGATLFFWLWPRLEKTGERLVARWRRTYDWVQSSTEERYRADLAQWLARQHDWGSAVALAQVFVPPKIIAPLTEMDTTATTDAGIRALYHLWPTLAGHTAVPPPSLLPWRSLWRDGRRVLLAAEAGAGKTTLLAYVGWLFATGENEGAQEHLPLWLHAADVAQAGWPSDMEGLCTLLQPRLGRVVSAGISDLLTRKFAEGHVLLLLDGADEMPASQLPRLASWLQGFLHPFPETRVLIAAPERGYAPLMLPGFVLSGLLPWRGGQAESLARQLAAATGQEPLPLSHFWSPGQAAWQTTLRLQQGAAGLAPSEKERPPRWVDRFEAALRTRLPAKDPPWQAPAARELWQEIAYRRLAEPEHSLTEADVILLAEQTCARYNISERTAPRRLLRFSEQSGLFTDQETGTWRFRSPIWRDFLAASHLAQTQPFSAARDATADPHWRGALRFYAARADAVGLVDAVLHDSETDPLQDGLFQAVTWLPEIVEAGDHRRQILLRLGRLVMQPHVPAVMRQRAILALAQTGEAGVLTLLRQLLHRPNPLLRQAVVAALPALGNATALDLLSQALADEDATVRQGVVAALGWLHHAAADKLLLRILSGDDEQLFQAAAEAIGLNAGADVATLQEAATLDDPLSRRAAVFGLALVEEEWATALLRRLQKDDQWRVQSVAEAAVELRESKGIANRLWQPTPPEDQPWLVEWATTQGRGVPGGAAALSVLVDVLQPMQPQNVRLAAIATIGQMTGLDGAAALASLLEDASTQVREAAFQALCQMSRAHGHWVGQNTGPQKTTT